MSEKKNSRLERAHAKYGKLSDTELVYKVKNRNFFTYGLMVIGFLFLLILSGFITGSLELPPAINTITIIAAAIVLVGYAFLMEKLDKTIKFDCQIEQQYRIEHPERAVGYSKLSLTSKEQSFTVNEHKKKQTQLKNLTATLGGKIAFGWIIVLVIATITLPIIIHINGYQIAVSMSFNDPEFGAASLTWGIAAILIIFLIISVAAFSRQRGRNIKMRIQEQLMIDKGILAYIYTMRPNRWYPANGKTLVLIDLKHTSATYDKRQNLIIFQGKIQTQLLTTDAPAKSFLQSVIFPFDSPIRPREDGTAPEIVPDGTNQPGYFELYDYFDPTLVKTLGLK